MEEVEYFRWMLPPSPWSKKPYASTWEMTREQAEQRHPGATPILSTRVVRTPPERGSPAWFGVTSQPMPGSDAWKALHPDKES